MPDFSRASWHLKIERAEKHLVELEEKFREYCKRHLYELRREYKGKPKPCHWRYVLRITGQPDPELAIIIGDVIHNVRSALDHLAVAIAPRDRRRNAGFPIVLLDIWEQDATGAFVVDDDPARKKFESQTRDMDPDAVAIMKQLQPYTNWPPAPHALRLRQEGGQHLVDVPGAHLLAILNSLENADKHRELTPIVNAMDLGVWVRHGDQVVQSRQMAVCPDGAVVLSFRLDPPINPEPEMQVEAFGTPDISMQLGLMRADVKVLELLKGLTWNVPKAIFPALEPFVRDD